MSLDVEIKARVSKDTKGKLEEIATSKGEGIKVSHVVREAVAEYLERQDRVAEQPGTYRTDSSVTVRRLGRAAAKFNKAKKKQQAAPSKKSAA